MQGSINYSKVVSPTLPIQTNHSFANKPNIETESSFNETVLNTDIFHVNGCTDTLLKNIVECKPIPNEYVFQMKHPKLSTYRKVNPYNQNMNIFQTNAFLKYFYNEKALLRLKHCQSKGIGAVFFQNYNVWATAEETRVTALTTPQKTKLIKQFGKDKENGKLILKYMIRPNGQMDEYIEQLYDKVKTGGANEIKDIVDMSIIVSSIQGACKIFSLTGVVNSKNEYIHPIKIGDKSKQNSKDDYMSIETFGRAETFPMVAGVYQGDYVAVYAVQIASGPVQFFFYNRDADINYLKFLFKFSGDSKAAGNAYGMVDDIKIKLLRKVYRIRMDEGKKYDTLVEKDLLVNQGVEMSYDKNVYYNYPENYSKLPCIELQKKSSEHVCLITVDVCLT